MSKTTSDKEMSDALAETLGKKRSVVQQRRNSFYTWMRKRGKSHLKQKGLAKSTADNYLDRLDQMHRVAISLLEVDDETDITTSQADELLHLLADDTITKQDGDLYDESAKRKFSNALNKYFEWQYHTEELAYEWRPRIKFSDGSLTSAAEFTYEEMGQLLQAAKSYGTLPTYYTTSDEERDRVNGLVAQRLGKPKENVNRDDWRKADQSTKIWALTSVGYDAGLTPVEVQKAEINWYKPDQKILKVPRESAPKEREKHKMSLSDESCEAMSQWIQERRHLEKYDGSNQLWLNRQSNAYKSGSLCNLIRKLCEEAEIPTEDRPIRWYSLRHTLGRHMKSDGSLDQTNDQLRHETFETTVTTYGNSAVEERHQTLNKSHEKIERAANDPDFNPYEVDVSYSAENPQQTGSDPENAVTPVSGGSVHVDAVIDDTTENRVDITQQLLSEEDSSNSS